MKLKVLIAAVTLLASTAASSAVDNDSAWFSLEGTSDPSVTATGGPGQTLVIDKPFGPGGVHLVIGYNFTNTLQYGSPTTMAAWGFTLDTVDLTGGGQNVTAGNGDFTLSQAAGYNLDIPNADPDPGAFFSAGALSGAGNGNDGLVFTFEIWVEKFDSIPTATLIFGDFLGQQTGNGFAWYGSIGPNTGRYGIPGYNDRAAELPLITINNVPEPATIALLGMGVVALFRRRR